MSNYNGDLLDEGLQNVMGKDRCQNVWEENKACVSKKETAAKVSVSHKEKTTRVDKAVDAQYEPVRPSPNHLDKLKACAKDALLYGALALLFFYFQQTGQMELTASMPCICSCVLLGGIGIGKHSVEG